MKWKVGFFLLFLFACSEGYDNSDLSIFKYNESNGISTLDPAFAKDKATIWATSQIFSQLVSMDNNLEVIPDVAKKWIVSEDGLTYSFYLRDDVFFHDHKSFNGGKGRKVIASDFQYSFDRLTDEKIASPGSWVLNNVKNYSAENDSTFIIELNSPFPPFLSLLSMQYCSVLPKEVAENLSFRSDPIGSGPFKFQFWKEGVKLVLRKNENYFEFEEESRLPYLDAIAVTFIKDKQSEFLNFLQGNLDFISGIDPSYKDEILTKEGDLNPKYQDRIIMQSLPFLNTEYLAFLMDNNSELSKNIYLRRAINYSIDKEKMLKYLRNNIGEVARNGFVPKGMSSFSDSVIGFSYNLDLAKENLELAGFPNANGLGLIVLNTTSAYLDLCEFIQSELKDIGITLKIEVNPPSTHRQMVATSKLSFFRGSWIADYPDAENYLSLFYSDNFSPNGPNYTHFKSEEFDNLYEEAIKETDSELRSEMYQELDRLIIKNSVVIPLYYDQVVRFYHINILDFYSNAQNSLNLKGVKKD
ncbi:MAG: ABC transporter substrate-binding protein [Flavobacteriales bacterium]|nr:ABC transporter substrate-binding protein [Flavobacteriales bacterium]